MGNMRHNGGGQESPVLLSRVPGVDVRRLKLSSSEGFVFSQIQETVTFGQLASLSDLPLEVLNPIVQRLISMGALSMSGKVRSIPPPVGPGTTPSSPARGNADGQHPVEKRKKEISQFYLFMEGKNYYELLGVSPTASRADIRQAYFVLSKKFHPDSAFTLDLGDAKSRMEIIFRTITRAYEVLSNKEKRAEYDEYIREELDLLEFQERLAEAQEIAEEAARQTNQGPRTGELALVETELGRIRPPKIRPRPLRMRMRPLGIPADVREKLRGQWSRERAGRALLNLLKSGKREPVESESRRLLEYIDMAEKAIARENHLEAVTVLKVALGNIPDNDVLKKMYESESRALSSSMARRYTKQGKYELRAGEPARALEHLRQAVELDRRNPEVLQLAARAVLESGGWPQEAIDWAKEALAISERAEIYAVLGDACIMMGQLQEANESYLKAAKLDPDNKDYKRKLKELKKRLKG